MRISSGHIKIAIVVLVSVCGCACLTRGLMNKALDRIPTWAKIRRVTGAATLNDNLYLLLEVESSKESLSGTVMLKIPYEEIGPGQHAAPGASIEQEGLKLRPPPLGSFEASTHLPDGAEPLSIETVNTGRGMSPSDWELAFAYRIDSLAPGVYVFIVQYAYEEAHESRKLDDQPPGTVPERGHLLVVRRIAASAPRQERVSHLAEFSKRHPSLLLLTPLTVVGDIVTFPFQLLAIVGD